MACLAEASCVNRGTDCVTCCSRPRSVKDVAHQEEVVQTLDKALQGSNVHRAGAAACGTVLIH